MAAKGVTAQLLYEKSNQATVKLIIDDIVRIIDAKIMAAHTNGFAEIEHELPTNFTINNMDVKDAQILVYSELIKIYKEKKKFTQVYLDFPSLKQSRIIIRWLNGMSVDEREQRKKLIEECMWRRETKK